jgi:hypothetical protein
MLLAACGSPQLPPAASAEAIDRAVVDAERQASLAKARTARLDQEESLVGA